MRQALTKAGAVGLLWLSVTKTACVNVLGSRSQSLYQTWKGMHVASAREGVQSTIRAPSHLCLVSSGRLASSQVTFAVLCLVTQSCRTLWPRGLQPSRPLRLCGFSRQEYWSGLSCPPPGQLSQGAKNLAHRFWSSLSMTCITGERSFPLWLAAGSHVPLPGPIAEAKGRALQLAPRGSQKKREDAPGRQKQWPQ